MATKGHAEDDRFAGIDVEKPDYAFLAAIVQSSDDGIIGKDLNGIITSWNKGAERIYGYSAGEVLGRPVSILAPPGRSDEVPRILERVKNGEAVKHFETIRLRNDGKRIMVSLSISPVIDRRGQIVGASTITRDITDRKKVEDERLQLAAIVQSSEDVIIGMTLDGTITSWNLGAERMFGHEASRVLGQSVRLIYPEDRPDELPDVIKKIKRGQPIQHYETQRKRRDGTIIDVSLSISPIKDEFGEVVGVSEIIRDFDGQKKAPRYARSIFEASLDPLVTISPDGKITDVNEAMVQVTGVDRDRLIGSNFSDHFSDPRKAKEGLRFVILNEKLTDYPLSILNSSGKTLDFLYNAAVFKDEGGRVLGVFASARDVTAQREGSQYARSLIEASLDPLVTISPDGKITDVNQATVKVTGVSREKLIGTDFSVYFTEPEEARQGYLQVFKEGYVTDYPLTIKHESGTLTDVLYNATVYRDDKGRVLGVFAAARDITARKKVEEQLHATSAYARSLIEASLDPLVTISPDGKITDVNRATELITGVSREWLIGTDFSNYFTEPRRARQGYRQVFKEGSVRNYPLTIRNAFGKVTDVLYNANVYRDAEGKVRGVFAAARDVTETKQASQYARSLIEASLDPLVTISPDGKITDVNQATVKVTGVSRERLVGSDFSDYFTEPEKARQGYLRVFKEGYVTDYPLTIRSVSGSTIEVLYNASVYKDDKGNVLGVFAAARDYSRAKEEGQLLQEANKDLEAFTYSVSHDLRAPLRAIDSFSKILVDEHSASLNPEARRLLTVVRENARKMGNLIDDLLAFSRLGNQPMRAQDVDSEAMVRAVFEELMASENGRVVNLDLKELPAVHVDPSMYKQIWTNLISNAIKFTRLASEPRIEIGCHHSPHDITFYVKDNGVGFDLQYAKKLFGVFQRLHSESEFEGTGVGLAIVRNLVSRHSGRIWADAKEGEGATFYFEFPRSLLRRTPEQKRDAKP